MKAHTLLLKAKSVAERADTYATRIKNIIRKNYACTFTREDRQD